MCHLFWAVVTPQSFFLFSSLECSGPLIYPDGLDVTRERVVLSCLQRTKGDGRWLVEQVDNPLPGLPLDQPHLVAALKQVDAVGPHFRGQGKASHRYLPSGAILYDRYNQ